MKNELSLYVEPETLNEETSTLEMKLYAELSGLTQSQEQIDKPADKRLVKEVRKAAVESETPVVPASAPVAAGRSTQQTTCRRTFKYGFTITDFILLIIAVLLFFNIITK